MARRLLGACPWELWGERAASGCGTPSNTALAKAATRAGSPLHKRQTGNRESPRCVPLSSPAAQHSRRRGRRFGCPRVGRVALRPSMARSASRRSSRSGRNRSRRLGARSKYADPPYRGARPRQRRDGTVELLDLFGGNKHALPSTAGGDATQLVPTGIRWRGCRLGASLRLA